MDQPAARRATPTAAIVAAIGGAVAFVGSFLTWFKGSVSFEGGEFFGVTIPGGTIPEQTVSLAGTKDWTGKVVLALGIIAALLAVVAIVAGEAGTRRLTATLAGVAGILALVVAVIGFVRAEDVAGEGAELGEALGVNIDASAGFGVYISAVGALVAAIGGFMARGKAGEAGGAMPGMAPPPPPSPGT